MLDFANEIVCLESCKLKERSGNIHNVLLSETRNYTLDLLFKNNIEMQFLLKWYLDLSKPLFYRIIF